MNRRYNCFMMRQSILGELPLPLPGIITFFNKLPNVPRPGQTGVGEMHHGANEKDDDVSFSLLGEKSLFFQ